MSAATERAERILAEHPDPPQHWKNHYGLATAIRSASSKEEVKEILDFVWANGVKAAQLNP